MSSTVGSMPERPTAGAAARVADLGLATAAALLRAREVSSVELTTAYLERIDTLDRALGAWARTYPERALADARAADRRRAAGTGTGEHALDGVPIGVKDTIAVAGLPRSLGSAAFADEVAATDAGVWARLRDQGLVLLGHQTTQELALGNAPQLVANPWSLDHSPGGTSNGGGAAVAAGTVPIALGTDVGGSLRRPASACGLTTFIATARTVPLSGVHSFDLAGERVGPLARDAADCALLATAITAPFTGFAAAPRLPDRTAAGPLGGVQIGRLVLCEDQRPAAAVAALVDRFAAELEELGAEIVPVAPPPYPRLDRRPRPEHVAFFGANLAPRGEGFSPFTRRFGAEVLRRAAREGVADRARDAAARGRYRGAWARTFAGQRLDALIVPGQLLETPPLSLVRDGGDLDRFGEPTIRSMWNLAGSPVVCLPAGRTPAGLPVGVQLVGAHHRDRALLALAIAYQEATSHHEFEAIGDPGGGPLVRVCT
ncbi:MAG: amidase [Actinobacteria bacterium]|nr:amidase [Actinomycetota bacterium]